MKSLIGLVLMLAAGRANDRAAALPEFEAAYLAPSPPLELPLGQPLGPHRPPMVFFMQGGPGSDSPGELTCTRCPLTYLIRSAYEVDPAAIKDLDWMQEQQYDLVAKIPPGSTRHDVHLMLRQLLADRFELKVHYVPKQLPGYVLTLGKQPPKLQAAGEEAAAADAPFSFYVKDCIFHISAHGATMHQLADLLSTEVGSRVADTTGLEGRFDFTFAWYASATLAGQGACTAGHLTAGHDPLHAVRQQLGLKTASRNLPGEAVVVDSALVAPREN